MPLPLPPALVGYVATGVAVVVGVVEDGGEVEVELGEEAETLTESFIPLPQWPIIAQIK